MAAILKRLCDFDELDRDFVQQTRCAKFRYNLSTNWLTIAELEDTAARFARSVQPMNWLLL